MLGRSLSCQRLWKLRKACKDLSEQLCGSEYSSSCCGLERAFSHSSRHNSLNEGAPETTHFGFQTVAEDKKEEKGNFRHRGNTKYAGSI